MKPRSASAYWFIFSAAALSAGFLYTGAPHLLIPLAASVGAAVGGQVLTRLWKLGLVRARWVRSLSGPRVEGATAKVELSIANTLPLPLSIHHLEDRPPMVFEASPSAWNVGVGPRSEARVTYRVRLRMGRWCFGDPKIVVADPLGFSAATAEVRVGGVRCVTVRPRVVAVGLVELGGEAGRSPSQSPGVAVRSEGIDYYAFRDYQPGDDPRLIEWKITARKGDLVVREPGGGGRRGRGIAVIVASVESDWRPIQGVETGYEVAARLAYSLAAASQRLGLSFELAVLGGGGALYRTSSLSEAGDLLAEAVLPRQGEDVLASLKAAVEEARSRGMRAVLIATRGARYVRGGIDADWHVVVEPGGGDDYVRSVVERLALEAAGARAAG